MAQRYLTHLEKRSDFVEALRDSFGLPDPALRNREIKAVLERQRNKIQRLNREGTSGADTVRFISEMVDTLLRVLWDQVEMGMPDDANLVAVVAVVVRPHGTVPPKRHRSFDPDFLQAGCV